MWSSTTTTTASAKSMWLVHHEWPNDWLSVSVEVHPTPKRQNYPSHQFTGNGMNWSVSWSVESFDEWMDGCVWLLYILTYSSGSHPGNRLNIQRKNTISSSAPWTLKASTYPIWHTLFFFVEIYRMGLLTRDDDKCVSSN